MKKLLIVLFGLFLLAGQVAAQDHIPDQVPDSSLWISIPDNPPCDACNDQSWWAVNPATVLEEGFSWFIGRYTPIPQIHDAPVTNWVVGNLVSDVARSTLPLPTPEWDIATGNIDSGIYQGFGDMTAYIVQSMASVSLDGTLHTQTQSQYHTQTGNDLDPTIVWQNFQDTIESEPVDDLFDYSNGMPDFEPVYPVTGYGGSYDLPNNDSDFPDYTTVYPVEVYQPEYNNYQTYDTQQYQSP